MYVCLIISFIIFGIHLSYTVLKVKNNRELTTKYIHANKLLSSLLAMVAIIVLVYVKALYGSNYINDFINSCIVLFTMLAFVFSIVNVVENELANSTRGNSFVDTIKNYLYKRNREREVNCSDTYKSRIKSILIPAIYIIYVVFISGIYEIYFTNITEWNFSYKAIIVPIMLGVVIISSIFFFLSFVLRGRMYERLLIFLLSVCILFYIQTNFLNERIVLRGSYVESNWWSISTNVLFWLTGLFFAFKIKISGKVKKILQILVLLLLLIQVPVLPVLFFNSFSNGEGKRYALDGSEQYEIGSEENVIVFVLDSFYSGYFDYFTETYPQYNAFFSDFEYYNDANARAFGTALSFPSFLTGTDVDNTVSMIETNYRSWHSESANYFYDTMHEMGYTINLYTDSAIYSGGAENMVGKIDNVVEVGELYSETSVRAYIGLLRESGYRVVPLAIKNFLCVLDSNEINVINLHTTEMDLSDDPSAISDFQEEVNIGIDYYNSDYFYSLLDGLSNRKNKKCLIIQHLFGMHTDYEELEGLIYPNEIQGKEEKALLGCFVVLNQYFSEMKKLGVYDNSTIIIVADHGMAALSKNSPLVLIKPANSSIEQLEINNAPIDLQNDLLPTILYSVNADIPDYYNGIPIQILDEDAKRSRVTRVYEYSAKYPRAQKCNGMGDSVVNYYKEYEFVGKVKEFDFESSSYTEHPIVDYWW